ncbi:MAG: thioredoxin fold domain-containing protein [Deltaproteobacteria bacterium]|nr:thioredoxin fold domain-containing protein [Deltaproteobacteria bacterium]
MFNHIPRIALLFLFVSIGFLSSGLSSVLAADKTFEDLYPGLASGALKAATLATLPQGTLLIAGDLVIKESEITKMIRLSERAVRKQLTQNAFFLLENMVIKRMLFQEASRAGFKEGDEDRVIMDFLSKEMKIAAVSEEELGYLYNRTKEMFGGAPLEEVRGMLKEYLAGQKREEAVRQYILTLGKRTPIRINEVWVKKYTRLALDNPVDRVRLSGKPTLVEFGAPGCPPCDMMKPVLANLKKKFSKKLNVLFVHVGKEQFLGNRFGIQVIPVQVFFDKKGLEVFRHTGFFSQAEIENKMTQLGLLVQK